MNSPRELELERIRAEYERRSRELDPDFYALDRPTNLFLRHGQQRMMVESLSRAGFLPLRNHRILDVGCGRGGWLSTLHEFGARVECLAGIDLLSERVEECRRRMPEADIRQGDASQLPWTESSFDVVVVFTVFTSILKTELRSAIALEIDRVLRPGGAVLWYDFFYDNPNNANVRSVDRRELALLFGGYEFDLRRATLAPPLARRIVPRSWVVASALESLRFLNTHWLGTLRKRL